MAVYNGLDCFFQYNGWMFQFGGGCLIMIASFLVSHSVLRCYQLNAKSLVATLTVFVEYVDLA